MLAVLADSAPVPVTRDRLIALIWPDHPEAGARRLLTQSLYAIRRELGEVVVGSGRDLSLDPAAICVDLVELRQALAAGDAERASVLHRGPLFAGFHLRGSGEFDRWADGVRAEVERRLQRALEAQVTRLRDGGEPREAARWSERLVHAAPYDANAVLECMALWARAGDPRAALAAAAAYDRRMRHDLELEPDSRVAKLASELAARAGSTSPRATAAAGDARAFAAIATEEPASGVAHASAGTPQRLGPRRRVPAFVAVTAVATLAAIGALLVRERRAGDGAIRPAAATQASTAAAAREPASIPVHAFDLQGLEDSTELATTVARTLVASLDGSGGRRVIAAPAATSDDTSSVPRISGTIAGDGEQLRIDVELRLEGAAPVRASATGARDSVLALVDRVGVQLVPHFFRDLPAASDLRLQRYTSARALRLHLEGEAAMRHGSSGAAHRAFRSALQVDSTLAWTWYRRAVAADASYDDQDGDFALQRASSLRARLSARERGLLRAYGHWREGDLQAAEPLYREVLESGAPDGEAWLHFAELAYHGWPLHGRPLDAATDAWQHVVELDSANVTGLIHALRLAARARDTAAVRALLARAERAGAGEPGLSESRLVASVATGVPLSSANTQRQLESLPAYSLYFLHWVMAGILEQPQAGAAIAAQLTQPHRPVSVRAEGHVALAHIAAARGQLRRARAELSLARRLDPVAAAWSRAYLALLPHAPATAAELRAAQQELAAAPRDASTAPLYLQLAVEAPAAPVIEGYLERLLRAADTSAREEGGAALACGAELPQISRELCRDLALGLRAEGYRARGQHTASLRELERLRMRVPYQVAGRSSYFARSRERFLRALLLERLGRLEEAYLWYASAPHGSRLDYVYLAPSHLARGRIREREGDRGSAADHYRQAIELWRNADPELAGLLREAAEGLRRVSTPAAVAGVRGAGR